MKALKIIGIIILIILVLFFVIAAFLPGNFKVEQTIEIDTQVECPYNKVNNLRMWDYWTPFIEGDPEMVTTYSGPAAGIGATSHWTSKKQGDGTMTISTSIPHEKIITDLDFGPRGMANGYFLFEEVERKTSVTWGMESEAGYPIGRYIMAFMKGMMNERFRTGLENLKAHCESMEPETNELSLVTISGTPSDEGIEHEVNKENPHLYVLKINGRWIATITDSCKFEDIAETMSVGFLQLMLYVNKNNQLEYGNPFSIWHTWDPENNFARFELGISLKNKTPDEERIKVRKFKHTRAVTGIHEGPYDQSEYMYNAIERYIEENGMEANGNPIEAYILDYSQVDDPSELRTAILFPIK